jgi:D-glycero-D-manno-heptose 1,7-bisphosphate phosphatase
VLLDRDGTLNHSPGEGWVTEPGEFVPIDGAFEAVARLNRAGWPVAVVTNQSCVGRGLASAEQVERVNRECLRVARERGAVLDAILVCPHGPEDHCSCRKPLPGLLLRAAQERSYDLLRSYMVGDSPRDLLAGRAAGATPLLVLTGKGDRARAEHPPHLTFPSLAEAVDWILLRRPPEE